MKEILLDYAKYNVWANDRVIELLHKLDENALDQEQGGSFGTIRQTVYHIWGAESIWYQRLQMAEHLIIPQEGFTGTFAEACTAWLAVSKQYIAYIEKQFDDRGFEHEFVYRNLKKEQMKSKVWEALHHCLNHSTFHRGQLIIYARMLGLNKIPATDQIAYSRERK
jgi:uncharacterized damage-inducible protein DinB